MTIYSGNTEIKDLYYGGQKISEAYYGNTKVYSSLKGIPVWLFINGDTIISLLGEYTTNGLPTYVHTQDILGSQTTTISGISGTIGSSGSSVSVSGFNYNLTYNRTFQLNGHTIHSYIYVSFPAVIIYVLEDSTIGSCVFVSYVSDPAIIQSLSDSSISIIFYEGSDYPQTATRDTSYLKYWTKDGLIE